MTDEFTLSTGVRQGCVLSPILFNIYMDRITSEANQEGYSNSQLTRRNQSYPDVYPDSEEEDHFHLNEILFADDQSLIHETENDLQIHTSALHSACTDYNMKISTTKTEVMAISRTPNTINIQVDNIKLKQVQLFKYLGSVFTEDGKIDKEIEARCQKANAVTYQLSPLLKHPNISMTLKRQLINCIFIPTLCYQCQTWSLTKTQEKKITTCEMRCLRKAANVTRRDRIRNVNIRNVVGTSPCLKYIEKQKIKWFSHLMRMEPDQLPLQAYNKQHSCLRARGRPRVRWIDNVSEILQQHGLTTTSATHMAQDRKLQLPTTLKGKCG